MRGRGRSNTTEIRPEEVEPAEVKPDVSGKSQADVWSEGSDSKPVNVEAGCGEREGEDKELYIFSQCAPAPTPSATPKGRAAQPPWLIPAATSERRAASPAPLTTANDFGRRATPATIVSVNIGPGSAEFEGSGISNSPSVGREGSYRVLNEDAHDNLGRSTRGTEAGEASACVRWEESCEA